METAPAPSARPISTTPAPTSVCVSEDSDGCVIGLEAAVNKKRPVGSRALWSLCESPSDHAGLDHGGAQAGEVVVDELVEFRSGEHGRRPVVLGQRFGPGLGLE